MASKTKGHVMAMRYSSIALAVLSVWFVFIAAGALRYGSYGTAVDFLTQPLNAIITGLLAVVSLYHMALGMEEVILDYIHKPGTKSFLLFLNKAVCFVLGLAALYALYSLNFGA